MADIPPKLAERLADLDRLIIGTETDIADFEANIRSAWLSLEKYRLAKQEIEEAVAICREAWCSPGVINYVPPVLAADLMGPISGSTAAGSTDFTHSPPRQRRDLREVVRQILRGRQLVLGVGNEGIHATEIAELASRPGRSVRTSEILRALARMDSEVTHDGAASPEACLWWLAVGPTDTIPREHQTDVPQCWCGYSHAPHYDDREAAKSRGMTITDPSDPAAAEAAC